jgi:hypothetical protein
VTSWPFVNPDEDGDIHKIPVSTLYRWYLYDTLGDEANQYIDVFNLSPVSEEGDEKEIEESERRLGVIDSLLPFISLYATMTAQCSFEAHRKEMLKIPGVTESVLESSADTLKEFYSALTFNGLVSAFAAAVDLKLVTLPGFRTGIQKEKNEQ